MKFLGHVMRKDGLENTQSQEWVEGNSERLGVWIAEQGHGKEIHFA